MYVCMYVRMVKRQFLELFRNGESWSVGVLLKTKNWKNLKLRIINIHLKSDPPTNQPQDFTYTLSLQHWFSVRHLVPQAIRSFTTPSALLRKFKIEMPKNCSFLAILALPVGLLIKVWYRKGTKLWNPEEFDGVSEKVNIPGTVAMSSDHDRWFRSLSGWHCFRPEKTVFRKRKVRAGPQALCILNARGEGFSSPDVRPKGKI